MTAGAFTEAQQRYLEGLASGLAAGRLGRGGAGSAPAVAAPEAGAATPPGPDAAHHHAQDRFVAAGRSLTPEERAKREKHPFDMGDEMHANAAAGRFPKGLDVFRYKFHGLFYVGPTQDAFMCRLRVPHGTLTAPQLRGVAEIAERWAGGYAHVTTRANLQLREIAAGDALRVLTALHDLGIVPRGAGADNVRNVTASPTAGIDPQELLDARPHARELHHRILGSRELYGLPRKFNVAFDGGGRVSTVVDTNDVGFAATRVRDGADVPPGVYYRILLGGVTGHGDFAADTGFVVAPADAAAAAVAIVRVYLEHGDRTDRARARLKYLLADWGVAAFMARVRARAGVALHAVPASACEPRAPIDRLGHVGVHPQRDPARRWVGVALRVGRLEAAQMRGLAAVAERDGGGEVRLTVWQNLLIPDVPAERVDAVEHALAALDLTCRPTAIRAGLVACTGNRGCKFAASDTKGHGEAIVRHLERRLTLDQPLNVHLTGCPNSCAQHYVGDIGLLGTRIAVDDETEVEGYHVLLGGGCDERQALAVELARDVPAERVPALLAWLLELHAAHRRDAGERFDAFVRRLGIREIARLLAAAAGDPA